MKNTVRGLLGLGLFVLGLAAFAQDKDEMVENPKYKYWSNFKANASSTYHEVTKLAGDKDGPGVEEKTITYRLLSANKDKVVVVTTVVEEDDLGTVESAPTKLTFPGKVTKAKLSAFYAEHTAKLGDGKTIKVGKEDIKCKSLVGTYKKDGATVEFAYYFSEAVPGGVVLRTRKASVGDKVVAETTITLRSYTIPPIPKPKDKDKDAKDKAKDKDKDKAKDKEAPKDKAKPPAR